MRLDPLDIRILNALQADNRITAEALSQALPLSPSAITRRLQRLRAEGAIVAETAVLSEALTAGRLSALIQVQLDRHTPEGFQRLRQELIGRGEVQWCAEISGAFDLALLVTARSIGELNELVDVMSRNPAVRRAETSLVKRRWKATLAVPLDEEDAA
jgi:Lrp/AsnC family transcriptional regulator, leucine-responsive regulatory protein